ncbi:MAG: class II fructose-bisphosphate aldolase [Patescibacteria group bacterium]
MKSLIEIIKEAEAKGVAIGHFNISDLVALKAIFEAAREINVPVMIGTSEGEGDFVGRKQSAALVRVLREEFDYPIFLNSDHTKNLEKVKEAVRAGYDEILFDGSKLAFEENVKKTKEVVLYVKSINPDILVEGEIGYIGSASEVREELPEGVAIKPEDLTTPEEAKQFVYETGVDMLAPAVGNLHGMFANMPDPNLDIDRIRAIKEAVKLPLVLHGGSGNTDRDFRMAIQAGVVVVHINTEIRLAWRKGLEAGLSSNPNEVAPYKILPLAFEGVKGVVLKRLKLFNKLDTPLA